MTASDVDHKIVFNQGDAPEPSAKASHGTHQRTNALGPLQSRSRSGPPESDMFLLILSRPNENKIRYGYRHRGLLEVKMV